MAEVEAANARAAAAARAKASDDERSDGEEIAQLAPELALAASQVRHDLREKRLATLEALTESGDEREDEAKIKAAQDRAGSKFGTVSDQRVDLSTLVS